MASCALKDLDIVKIDEFEIKMKLWVKFGGINSWGGGGGDTCSANISNN